MPSDRPTHPTRPRRLEVVSPMRGYREPALRAALEVPLTNAREAR